MINGTFKGEIRNAVDVGYKSPVKMVWVPCSICDKYRWISIYSYRDGKKQRCRHCWIKTNIFQNNHKWRGGKIINGNGYVMIRIGLRKYKFEHRIIMEEHIGRPLKDHEIIHHKNGERTDNRIENLELTNKGKHIKDHHRGYTDGFSAGYSDGQNKMILDLQGEIVRLNNIISNYTEKAA